MNAIFNGFHKPEYFSVLQSICEYIRPEQCHIIYETDKIKLSKDIRAFYYPCAVLSHEYLYNEPAEFLPLDAEILDCLSDCEAVCLKMMERDEIAGVWSYNKRKHVYLTHLRYWNHIFRTENIGLFLTSNIPHVVYDYIIYALCRHFKVRTVLFYQFQPGLSFIMEDWQNPTPGLRLEMETLANKASHELPVSRRLQLELSENKDPDKAVTPFYMIQGPVAKAPGAFALFKSLARRVINKAGKASELPRHLARTPYYVIEEAKHYYRIRKNQKRLSGLVREYEKLCVEPDLQSDFVYLPLHLQPELSTSPMGGVFVDQALIAEMLDYYLPKSTVIYVKEHPNQRLSLRDNGFFTQLSQCPKVRFVSRTYNSRKLIRFAKAVATCTGTAGWEAILSEKPVLLFGYTFYQEAPGVYPIRSRSDCIKAIQDIWESPHSAKNDDLIPFLHLLDKYAVYADIDPDYMNIQESNWRKNSDAITGAIEKILRIR